MNYIESSICQNQQHLQQQYQYNSITHSAFLYHQLHKQEKTCPQTIRQYDISLDISNSNKIKPKKSELVKNNPTNSEKQIENEIISNPSSFTLKKGKTQNNYNDSIKKNPCFKGSFNINRIKSNISPLSTSISSSQSSSSFSLSLNSSSSFISSLNISTNQYLENIHSSNSLCKEKNNNCHNPILNKNTASSNSFNVQLFQQQIKPQIQHQTIQSFPETPQNSSENKFKTEMCKNWMEYGKCNYSKKCQFAHGKNELIDKSIVNKKQYKSKQCQSFHTQMYCPYGTRCMFIHEERSIYEIKSSFYYQKILYENFEVKKNSYPKLQLENRPLHSECELNTINSSSPPILNMNRLPIFQQITPLCNSIINSTSIY